MPASATQLAHQWTSLYSSFRDATLLGDSADIETRSEACKRCAEDVLGDNERWQEGSLEDLVAVRLIANDLLKDVEPESDLSPDSTLLYHIGWDLVHLLSPYLQADPEEPSPAGICSRLASDLLRAISKTCNPREVLLMAQERLSFLSSTESSSDYEDGDAREYVGIAHVLLRATKRIKKGKNVVKFAANACLLVAKCLEFVRADLGKTGEERVNEEFERRGPLGSQQTIPVVSQWSPLSDSILSLYLDLADLVLVNLEPPELPPLLPMPEPETEVYTRLYLTHYLVPRALEKVVSRMPFGLAEGSIGCMAAWSFVEQLVARGNRANLNISEILSFLTSPISHLSDPSSDDDHEPDGDDRPLFARFPLSAIGSAVLVCLSAEKYDLLTWKPKKESDWEAVLESIVVLLSTGGSEQDVEAADKACAAFSNYILHMSPSNTKLDVEALFGLEDAAEQTQLLRLVQSVLMIMCTTPSPVLRTGLFNALSSFAHNVLTDRARLQLIGELLRPGPLVGVGVAGVSIFKDSVGKALDGSTGSLFASPAALQIAMQILFRHSAPAYTTSSSHSSDPRIDVFGERHSILMHALNFYIFWLARDQADATGIRSAERIAELEVQWLAPLRKECKVELRDGAAKLELAGLGSAGLSEKDRKTAHERLTHAMLVEDMVERIDSFRRQYNPI